MIADRLQEIGMLKFAPREKTEEEKQWEIDVKDKSLYSTALRELTEEYPEKFGENINGSIDGKTIILTGDLDILKSEVYERVLEFNGEKEEYRIVLKN